jgi:hypothetical protein
MIKLIVIVVIKLNAKKTDQHTGHITKCKGLSPSAISCLKQMVLG